MHLKKSLSEYTEEEFIFFLKKLFEADEYNEDLSDTLLDHFCNITEHPEGSDLIYYAPDNEANAETILKKVKEWRSQQGLPGFKSE